MESQKNVLENRYEVRICRGVWVFRLYSIQQKRDEWGFVLFSVLVSINILDELKIFFFFGLFILVLKGV